MSAYWIKRILWIIPILWVISIGTFFLSKMTPGDPVLSYMNLGDERRGLSGMDDQSFRAMYQQTAQKYHLDKPQFYFSLTPLCCIEKKHLKFEMDYLNRRQQQLSIRYGSYELAHNYLIALKEAGEEILNTDDAQDRIAILQLDTTIQSQVIDHVLMQRLLPSHSDSRSIQQLVSSWQALKDNDIKWWKYFPLVQWHGWQNQYHFWMSGLTKVNLGVSLSDGRPVSHKIGKALYWTLPFNLLAFLMIIVVSILVGVYTAIHRTSKWANWLENGLLVIYSVPLFWLCTLAVSYISGGKLWNIFPSPAGIDHLVSEGIGDRLWTSFHFILLPLICLVVSSLAGLSRQVKHLMEQEMQKPYIQASIVRGISRRRLIWNYALRNAMIPLTAYIGRLIPALFSGLIVVESIFNIPGIGSLLVRSVYAKDWTVAFPVFMISALFTVIGVLIADALLAKLSPMTVKAIQRVK